MASTLKATLRLATAAEHDQSSPSFHPESFAPPSFGPATTLGLGISESSQAEHQPCNGFGGLGPQMAKTERACTLARAHTHNDDDDSDDDDDDENEGAPA